MKRLYIFNPEHDMALAANSPNYLAPESALFLASDLATLPRWYAEPGGEVFDRGDLEPVQGDPASYDVVIPWGWDQSIRRLLIVNGIDEHILPTVDEINEIRDLSHRRTGVRAMNSLRTALGHKWTFPTPAAELHTVDKVREYAEQNGEIVLKAPWSSSGRGVFWTRADFTASMTGWIKRVIEKQGSVMAELAMERVSDFAMEFRVVDHQARFVGYSLFFTEETGAYRGNRLLSNDKIVGKLSERIPREELTDVREQLLIFLNSVVAPIYNGYVGVDMFIYRGPEGFLLNPVVEINLRMTMGVIARILFDKYVSPDAEGMFLVEHKSPGRLYVHHQWQKEKEKMQYDADGRMMQGYLSLCPVTPNTLYRASIVLN